jgi:hypothetical protein
LNGALSQVTHTAPKYNAELRTGDTYDGEKGDPLGWFRRFTLSGDLTELPMKIVRKRAAVRMNNNKNALRESFKVQLVNETPDRKWTVLLDDVCAALERSKKSVSWLHPTTSAESVDAALATAELTLLRSLREQQAQLNKTIGSKKSLIAAKAALQAAESRRDQVLVDIEAIEGRALGLTPQQRATRTAYMHLIEERTALNSALNTLNKRLKAKSAIVRGEQESSKAKIAELSATIRDTERRVQQVTLSDVAPPDTYVDSDYFGFQVNGNGRFVVGERCFVTHNSTALKILAGKLKPNLGDFEVTA